MKNMASVAKKTTRGRPKNVKETNNPQITNEDYKAKAKEKINELLGDINLTTQERKKIDEEISKEEMGGINWLSEQVDLLTKENERLKSELDKLKMLSTKESMELKNRIIEFFTEFQTYYLKWGNLYIDPPSFMKKMVKTFPFLQQHSR